MDNRVLRYVSDVAVFLFLQHGGVAPRCCPYVTPFCQSQPRLQGPMVGITSDPELAGDRKSTRLNSSHANISSAVFCLKKLNRITSYIPAESASAPYNHTESSCQIIYFFLRHRATR